MDLGIKGKVFLVTGGASGIGEAICRSIAAEEGIPVIIDRDDKKGVSLANGLKSSGAFFIKTDLIEESQCKSAVDTTFKKYGRIDSLINNAG
ncbi:MAG: SDR family NAD(P)-dependent oxidoreductase, partial [Bacteroidetes bacterium]|nr:SDR family NAD(P)-dependent oxidoreductase [Bacteroidota bacterium]